MTDPGMTRLLTMLDLEVARKLATELELARDFVKAGPIKRMIEKIEAVSQLIEHFRSLPMDDYSPEFFARKLENALNESPQHLGRVK